MMCMHPPHPSFVRIIMTQYQFDLPILLTRVDHVAVFILLHVVMKYLLVTVKKNKNLP